MTKKIRRSWLLVPMSKPALIAEAAKSGAHAIVLDLAELVAAADKPAARKNVQAAIQTVKTGGADVFAQINPAALHDDLHERDGGGLTGFAQPAQQTGVGQFGAGRKF